jgi:VanZ family protein
MQPENGGNLDVKPVGAAGLGFETRTLLELSQLCVQAIVWAWIQAHRRVLLWASVVAITLALPHVVVVFQMLSRHFPSEVVQRVPWIIVMILGVVYVVTARRTGYSKRFCGMLATSLLITLVLLPAQRNPNKVIHIPEYILMTWLLFQALSIDYRGKGIYALTFICASMLGVLDELMQGAHPARFYGITDMGLNAAASIIGVLSLAGVRRINTDNAAWLGRLGQYRGALILLAFAMLAAGYMCGVLNGVRQGPLSDMYPPWLFLSNGLLAVGGGLLAVRHWSRLKACLSPERVNAGSSTATVHLWILCLSVILTAMHSVVFAIVLFGLEFK